MNARKRRATTPRSFQSASTATTTPTTISVARKTRRALSATSVLWPLRRLRKRQGKAPRVDEAGNMPANRDEHVCLEMRRHGIVLARPLVRSGGVAIAGIFVLTLPWAAAAVVGAALIAVAAAFTLRAVWQWERTRIVVTTEKLYVVNGTLRRRTKAVKLRAVDAVELDQSLLGRLMGYGTVVVGPLTVGHVAGPRESAS